MLNVKHIWSNWWDVLRKMLSKLLLLCRIFTVSGAVALFFLPFSWIYFIFLFGKHNLQSFLVTCWLSHSHVLRRKAHNSVPWLFVGFNLLLKTSCFLWVALLLQLEQCNLASVYLVFAKWSWPPMPFYCFSGPALADVSESDGLLLSKSGRVLEQTVVELCSTMGVDKGMCTSLYFSFKNFIPCPKVQ